MIKLSKKEFNKAFVVKSEINENNSYTINSEFRELIEILVYKTKLDFFEILDLIKESGKK